MPPVTAKLDSFQDSILRTLVLQGPMVLPHNPVTDPLLALHPCDVTLADAEPVRFSADMLRALMGLRSAGLATLRAYEFSGRALGRSRWWEPQFAGLLVPTPEAWTLGCRWPGVAASAYAGLTPSAFQRLLTIRRTLTCGIGEGDATWRSLASRRLIEIMGRPGDRVAVLLPFGAHATQIGSV